jgi:hypothetical protein
MEKAGPATSAQSLDPAGWPSLRAQAHRMLDDSLDYLEQIRDRPVWQPIPDQIRADFSGSVSTSSRSTAPRRRMAGC